MYEILQVTQKNHISVTNSLCQVWQQKNSGPVMKKLRSVDEKNSGQAQKNSGLTKKKLRFSEIIWSSGSRKKVQKKSLVVVS